MAGVAAARGSAFCLLEDPSRHAARFAAPYDLPGRSQKAAHATFTIPPRKLTMHLLNPGPVTLTERVRRSLLQPDLCHRESEFFDLQDEIRTRLLSVHDLRSEEHT